MGTEPPIKGERIYRKVLLTMLNIEIMEDLIPLELFLVCNIRDLTRDSWIGDLKVKLQGGSRLSNSIVYL